MKMRLKWLLAGASLAMLIWVYPAAAQQVKLSVLNPRGEIPPPPVSGIRPRLTDLAGKKIGLLNNGKFGADTFLQAVGELLKQKYPTVVLLPLNKPNGGRVTFDAKDWYPEAAKQVDGFVLAAGD